MTGTIDEGSEQTPTNELVLFSRAGHKAAGSPVTGTFSNPRAWINITATFDAGRAGHVVWTTAPPPANCRPLQRL